MATVYLPTLLRPLAGGRDSVRVEGSTVRQVIDNLEKGKEWIGYVQFADSPARNEPGTGEIRFSEVFRKVRELGLPLPLGAECLPKGGDAGRAAQRLYQADLESA